MDIMLDVSERSFLRDLLTKARHPKPEGWQVWYLKGVSEPLGLMPPDRARSLAHAMPQHMPLVQSSDGWVWHADEFSAIQRSEVLQKIANDLRDQGLLTGWRNENYACWPWSESVWPYARAELFRLERAAFRYWGLRSHASHVHGFTHDHRMWCGRRSLDKATDPGLLDNLAAGGLPAGEQPIECAVREVLEEAGLKRTPDDFLPLTCEVLTEREVEEGWHSERLFVFGLRLEEAESPSNRDGEVSEFICMDTAQVLHHLRLRNFTPDAACSIAKTWLIEKR